jgi:hypothetical protein
MTLEKIIPRPNVEFSILSELDVEEFLTRIINRHPLGLIFIIPLS